MTQKPAHEAAGKPTGGQFAKTSHTEAPLALESPATAASFAALMTEDLGTRIDESLKGRIKDSDPETGYTINQDFETTVEDDGSLSIYTDSVAMGESVNYAVAFRDGRPQVIYDDSYLVTAAPRTLHPEEWVTPDDAAAEISSLILDMESDIAAETGNTGQQDGFASDAAYQKWREG